jgi:hypothetical protein
MKMNIMWHEPLNAGATERHLIRQRFLSPTANPPAKKHKALNMFPPRYEELLSETSSGLLLPKYLAGALLQRN